MVAPCEGVLEWACIGVPDEGSGEAVKVLIAAKLGGNPERGGDPQPLPRAIGSLQAAKHVKFLDSLPKSSVSKILRRQLRQRC